MDKTDLLRECVEYNKTFNEIQRCFRRLENSFKHYLNIFNSIRDSIIVTDSYRNIIDVNKAFTVVFGYTKDEVLGKNSSIIYAEEEDYIYTGKEIFDARYYISGKIIEANYRRKNGETFRGEVSALKLVDEDMKPVGNIGVIRDITIRKRLNDELLESEARHKSLSKEYNDLLDLIPDGVKIISTDLKILWANQNICNRLGKPFIEIVGGYCYRLFHKRNEPCEDCAAIQALQTAKQAINYRTTSNGKIFEVRTFPVFDENKEVIQLRVISREVTEQKRIEEQLYHSQKMEAVGQLAGGISHDFNNILAAMMGYAELIKMKVPDGDDTLKKYINTLLICIEKASVLTHRLLLFSRKQVVVKKPMDINSIIINFETILRRIINTDIEINIELSRVALISMVDDNQMEQILMNFVTNARDAMDKGGTFTISTDLFYVNEKFIKINGFGKKGNYVHISVKDTGSGIDKDIIQRIFEPFFTTKEVGKGTGLGLSIAYNIIKQHDGYITVQSEPGVGTKFDIYLPYVVSTADKTLVEEKYIPYIKGQGITILLADDNEEFRKIIRVFLNQAGFKVIEAIDGEDALKKFYENKEDVRLLISDVIMPNRNGVDAYQEIAKIKPDLKAIFMSGYAAEILSGKGITESDLNFINKPVSYAALLEKLNEVLSD